MESKESSFFYIFHSPIDKVYSIFISPSLLTSTFFQNAKITLMKRATTLDDAGNEITMQWHTKDIFTFLIENTVNMPYFKTFRHRLLHSQNSFLHFDHIYNFFWNSTDKVTIFKFTAHLHNSKQKNAISEYILENKDSMCRATENYLIQTTKNVEENESISIECPIDEVWAFVSNVYNQAYFYPNSQKVKVEKVDERKIVIIDEENNNRIVFKVNRDEGNEDKKVIEFELVEANIALPKQKVCINLVRIDERECFVIFKHVIFEFIPFDVVMSYSTQKKKVLMKVKSMIEGKGKEGK